MLSGANSRLSIGTTQGAHLRLDDTIGIMPSRFAVLLCLLVPAACGTPAPPRPGSGATAGAGGASDVAGGGGAHLAGSGASGVAAGGEIAGTGGVAGDGVAGASAAGASDAGPFPLGATWSTSALHFRVRADAATALQLNLYQVARGADEVASIPMTRANTGAWQLDVSRAQLAALGVTTVYYGYRAWGPNWTSDPAWIKGSKAGFVSYLDSLGNRYNPNKLLNDPYAREISHDPLQPSALSTAPYTTGAANGMLDDGKEAPKSIALLPDMTDTGTRPARALKDDVIYEVHVRGLTMNDPNVPVALRGTFAGVALEAPKLAALGITALELLPIQETQNDQNDADTGAQNYWGYSTLGFFAPDRRYSSDKTPGGPTRELKSMVSALHASGLKVFLDVVYNHTAEGGASATSPSTAQIFSFRGLDNSGYYELTADNQGFVDHTGTGANFGTGKQLVQDLVLDSLSYWKNSIGIDGFRFDLGAVVGNACTSACYKFGASDPKSVLARAVKELPVRPTIGGSGVDLIAEPWGVGDGTYQLGAFPSGWSEWNGNFRDAIRTAQNALGTVPVTPNTLIAKIMGSPDLFNHDGRVPSASIDYVDCHDGFTLRDEYAYNSPEDNQAYPLGPSDGGSTANNSWDQGGSAAAQTQAARTGLALVALSSGVPMIQGGDEILRTQYGNNNAYNLDNSKMWLDWSLANENAHFVSWTSALFAFRRSHPALRPAKFFDGLDHNGNGLPDIAWLDSAGADASAGYRADSANHFIAWRVDGSEVGDAAHSILVAWNGWSAAITMHVPATTAGLAWYSVGDSASGMLASSGNETAFAGTTMPVPSQAISVMVER